MKRKAIKNLYADSIHIDSIHMDWSQGYPETWDYFQACECPECGDVVVNCDGQCPNPECGSDGFQEQCEGPMMNYYYPLPDSFERDWPDLRDAAIALQNLPLCIIDLTASGGNYALALTGGGMDLSWEICEAFMLLGYLPPLKYCRLPHMAGMKLNARNKWILAGCAKSAQVSARQAQWVCKDIRKLRQDMKA